MDDVLQIFGVVAALLGVVGSIVPGLPGPPVSWIGMLLVYLGHGSNGAGDGMPLSMLLIWLGVTVVVTVLDYVIPSSLTRMAGGHKAASRGALLGLLAGMFLTPIGMLGGCLLGAFIGELLVEDRGVWAAFKASLGAFLGFIVSTGMKLMTSGIMLYLIIKFVK